MSYSRYAIYYLPSNVDFARSGAGWLGWDAVAGRVVTQPDIAGVQAATAAPRRYGFHATIQAPFRLAAGCDLSDLKQAVAQLAKDCAPALAQGLQIVPLGRFLALTPMGDTSDICRLAASIVRGMSAYRAPLIEADFARYNKPGLTPAQQELLLRWGYPYVMEAYRFHMTLTGRLPKGELAQWQEKTQAHFAALPSPFILNHIALMGERQDGYFERIGQYALNG